MNCKNCRYSKNVSISWEGHVTEDICTHRYGDKDLYGHYRCPLDIEEKKTVEKQEKPK